MQAQASVRSQFVSVLAWIFIVMAGFATLISILQNVMINTVFPIDELERSAPRAPDMPAFVAFFAGHVRLFFAAALAVSAATFAAAIGLLMRKNWARLLFMGLLGLGIAWNILGLVAQQFMFSAMPIVPPEASAQFRSHLEGMHAFMIVMRVFSALFAIGLSVLFAWLIRRLGSPAVRAEFGAASRAPTGT